MPRAASVQKSCHLGRELLLPQGLGFSAPGDLGASRIPKRGLGRSLVSSRQLLERRFLLPVECQSQPSPWHRCVCCTGVCTPHGCLGFHSAWQRASGTGGWSGRGAGGRRWNLKQTSKMKSSEPPCFFKSDLTFKWNSKTWFFPKANSFLTDEEIITPNPAAQLQGTGGLVPLERELCVWGSVRGPTPSRDACGIPNS